MSYYSFQKEGMYMNKNIDYKFYSCKFDRVFKEVFLKESNQDLLKILLQNILGKEINKIEYNNIELTTGNVNLRKKYVDVLLTTDQGKIEIELNAETAKYLRIRNMAFLSNVYASHVLKSEEYDSNTQIMQINLTYGLGKEEKIKREYQMVDKQDGIAFVKNLKIIEINMDYYEELWHNEDIKEIEKNKYLVMLNRDKKDFKKFKDYLKESKEVDKYMAEVTRVNEDPRFIEYMTYEEDQKKIMKSKISEATQAGYNEGISQGYEQGIEQGIIQTAKRMLNKGITMELISEITGLSIEEIAKIKHD